MSCILTIISAADTWDGCNGMWYLQQNINQKFHCPNSAASMLDNRYDARPFCQFPQISKRNSQCSHSQMYEKLVKSAYKVWTKYVFSGEVTLYFHNGLSPTLNLHTSHAPPYYMQHLSILQHMITTHCRILPHNTSRESVMQLKSDVIIHHHPP